MLRQLNPMGVKALIKEVLETAYKDETEEMEEFIQSDLCEQMCFSIGCDWKMFRDACKEASRRQKLQGGLRDKVAREFWFDFTEDKGGQQCFVFTSPRVVKLE